MAWAGRIYESSKPAIAAVAAAATGGNVKATVLDKVRLWLIGDSVRAVCLALGVLQIFIVVWPNPHLIVISDSIGYLGPAVDALERGHFTHLAGRGFVYPLFLLGVLNVSPEPLAIVYAQCVLVLVSYAAMACSAWLLTSYALQKRLASRAALTTLAGFWLLTYVAYPPTIILAHSAMAECMFSVLLAMILLCVVVVALPETSANSRRTALVSAPVLGIVLLFVKPHWLLAGLLLPFLLLWLVPSGQRRRALGWIFVPLLLATIAFAVPEKLLQNRYDAYTSQIFGPRSLFCNSADLIYNDMVNHAHDSSTDQLRILLGEVLSPPPQPSLAWPRLGFNGDRCMYGAAGKWVEEKYSGDAAAETKFYWQAYLGALVRQPGYLVKRVGSQLFWLASRPFGKTDASHPTDPHNVVEVENDYKLYGNWMKYHKPDLSGVVNSPFARFQVEVKVFYFISGLALMLSLVLAGFRLVVNREPPLRKKPVDRAFFVVLLLCLAISCLVAIVHTFDIARYFEMQMPLFSLLGLLAGIVALRPRNVTASPAL